MKITLQRLSEKVIAKNPLAYSEEQIEENWICYDPASQAEIMGFEKRMGIKLPKSYLEFLMESNGLEQYSDGEMRFHSLDEVDFPSKIVKDKIEIWNKVAPNSALHEALEKSLLIAHLNSEQYLMLMPYENKPGRWSYVKFSKGVADNDDFETLIDYFKDQINLF